MSPNVMTIYRKKWKRREAATELQIFQSSFFLNDRRNRVDALDKGETKKRTEQKTGSGLKRMSKNHPSVTEIREIHEFRRTVRFAPALRTRTFQRQINGRTWAP